MNRRDFLTMTGMGAVGAAFAKTSGETAGPAAAKALREGLTADRAYAGYPGGAANPA